jgi:hypothetical protein
MRLLDTIACVGFIAALIALPLSFYYFRRAPIRSALFFGVPLLVFMGATSTSQSLAQARVLDTLDLCSPENSTVLVNGHEVSNSAEVLSTLRELRDLPAHHSSPSRRFSVDIRGPKPLSLVLARDSGDPREYWVFYPTYMITRYNKIGRIRTSTFDAY